MLAYGEEEEVLMSRGGRGVETDGGLLGEGEKWKEGESGMIVYVWTGDDLRRWKCTYRWKGGKVGEAIKVEMKSR